MTSGTFRAVPTNSLRVRRDQRQRRNLDPKKIEELAKSIKRIGLINPLTISPDGEIIAGERRWEAIKTLGWDQIPTQLIDDLDEHARRAIELEENIKRLDLTWQEQCAAIVEYHLIRVGQEPTWSNEKTAVELSMDESHIRLCLQISREAESDPEIMRLDTMSTVKNKIARDNEREAAALGEERRRGIPLIEEIHKGISVITADFHEWAAAYSGPRFNFIHCDFPYGINTNQRQQGNIVDIQGEYDDSPETYWRLLGTLCNSLNTICAESAHIMFWFSMRHYSDTLDFFANHSNFVIDPFPLVWLKDDGKGLLPDPQRGPRRIYETCLFGSRGDRKIVSPVANAVADATDSSTHVSIKPKSVLCHFFRMFVDKHSIVLDPTCGSGSALRAAESLGASHVLGVEIDGEFAEDARRAR